MAEAELQALRTEIDAIDDTILRLLDERMAVVKRVGLWKAQKASGLCPIRSGREATQLKRVSANAGAFSPAAAAHIWRHIINASLALEGRLAVSITQDLETQMWSREYFGSYTPHAMHAHAARVVEDITDGIADVGVAPLRMEAWWLKLVDSDLRVFAALPFIALSPTPHAFAFARLHAEPSGNDVTLAVYKNSVDCTHAYTTLATEGNASLLAVEGFHTELPGAAIIGAYAKPLSFK